MLRGAQGSEGRGIGNKVSGFKGRGQLTYSIELKCCTVKGMVKKYGHRVVGTRLLSGKRQLGCKITQPRACFFYNP